MGRHFSKTKLEKFKTIFENKKRELIHSIEKNALIELDIDGDETDVVQGNILSDIASRISQRDRVMLNKINASIKRIEEGSFGVCASCDGRIGEKRLIALPGCEICISCAEDQENMQKQFII